MMGLHSADNIHEFSNAMNMGLTLRDLKFNVHAHPTVAEVRMRAAGGQARPPHLAAHQQATTPCSLCSAAVAARCQRPDGCFPARPARLLPLPAGERGADPPRAPGERGGCEARGSQAGGGGVRAVHAPPGLGPSAPLWTAGPSPAL